MQPAAGGDVNVVAEELEKGVIFRLERNVKEGEELSMDYGPYYDRSKYSTTPSTVFPSDA